MRTLALVLIALLGIAFTAEARCGKKARKATACYAPAYAAPLYPAYTATYAVPQYPAYAIKTKVKVKTRGYVQAAPAYAAPCATGNCR